jgi:hypothetical protein
VENYFAREISTSPRATVETSISRQMALLATPAHADIKLVPDDSSVNHGFTFSFQAGIP